jgi:Strictosidine synthase-like, N-terminal
MKSLFRSTLVMAALSVVTSARADLLFVSLENANTIVSYDTTAGSPTPTAFASGLKGPGDMTFDSAGNLFVTMVQGTNYAVEKFTPAGVGSIFATAGLDVPDGLAFDSAGNLFVANQHSGQIVKYTPGGVGSVFASGMNTPIPVAFDATGNLYTTAAFGVIYKFTPDGVRSVFGNAAYGSAGLAFDSAGNLFASNYLTNTIYEFTPAGVRSVFATTGLNGPERIAFDSAGNLYASNYGNSTIEVFTPDGVGSVFAATASQPVGFAIRASAVPEPSNLISMGLGLAALAGYYGCRRIRFGTPNKGKASRN